MSGNQQLGHCGHNETDEDDDMLYTKKWCDGRHPEKEPNMKLVSAGVEIGETVKITDTFDRKPDAYAKDEDDDILYTNELWGGRHPGVFKISSEINKDLLKQETWRCKKRVTKKPKMKLVSPGVDIGETLKIIDTFDREPDAYAEGSYAQQNGCKAGLKDEPGQRIPKTGYSAEAGIRRARPEIASASANAGPLGVKVGLGVDTGASIGVDGVEAKFLGTGISIGPKTSVAVLGSEVGRRNSMTRLDSDFFEVSCSIM